MRQTATDKFTRRRFMRAAGSAVTITCLPSSLWSGDQAIRGGATSTSTNVDAMDEALTMLAGLAPLTNHGPMAAEALVALGRAESVAAFVESYKKRFSASFPATHQPVTRANWRAALGEGKRMVSYQENTLCGSSLTSLLSAGPPTTNDRLAAQLANRAIHYVRSQHILAAAGYRRPFVKQVVIEE
jgi:hypothetical protein